MFRFIGFVLALWFITVGTNSGESRGASWADRAAQDRQDEARLGRQLFLVACVLTATMLVTAVAKMGPGAIAGY